MNEILKKVSLSSLMFMMVFALSFGSFVPRASALSTGDLVKGPNSDAVYYVNGTMKHVFPDLKTYMTWYTNFDDVQTVTVAELDMLTTGAAVAYRPGTLLVTHPNTANVYAVEAGAKLRQVPDEATAAALYGADWGKMVRDVHELTFGQYTVGTPLTSAMHSEGTLLMKTGDTTIYYFDGSKIRPFANSAAFDANNLNFDFVVEVASLSGYSVGSSVTGAEDFATISGIGGTGTSVPTGTLSVSLSPNTAPGNTVLLGGAARQGMVTVRVSTGANAATIDSLTVERQGIASDAAFSSLDLIQSDTMLRLNKSSKTLNSSHQAVFNDDIMVPANTTWDIVVAANMAASLSSYAGEYPMFAVTSIVLKNATMSGTLPIVGNVMLTNGTITAGTARVAPGSSSISATTKEIGTKDYIVSSIRINNNSTETSHDMTVKQMTFTNNGSTAPSDVENIRLVNTNTGQTIATVAAPVADAITFSALNLVIKKGETVNFDLKLDIKGGSARTISYDIDEASDVIVWDNLRNVYVLATFYTTSSYATADTSSPYYDPADTTVGDGKLRIESVAIQDNKISENKTGVLLGKFKFVMEGEIGNVTALGLKISTTTSGTLTATDIISDLTNITVRNAAGNVVAGPQDPAANQANNGFTATTTDTISVPVGETIYSVYGDLSADWTANDTIQIGIFPAGITIKGDVSGNTITPTPSGQIQSTSMTIKSADLNVTLSGAPASQTVVAGTQNFEIANIVLDAADSGADVRVTNFGVVLKTTGTQFADNFTNIKLWVGGTEVPVDSRSTSCSAATCSTAGTTRATTSLTIASGNLTIPKNQSKTVKVTGNIGTGATADTLAVAVEGGMLTVIDSEAQTFTADVTNNEGNAMTITTGGTLNVAIASVPEAALVAAGTAGSKVDVGKFTLEPKFEGVTLNSFGFTLNAPDGGINGTEADQLATLELWELGGASALGTITVNGANATITPNTTLTLAQNVNKTYVIKAVFEQLGIDSSPADSGAGVAVFLSNIDVDGASVGSSSTTLNGIGTAFKTFTPFRTLPTVSLVSFAGDEKISVGEVDLMMIGVTANSAHDLGLGKLTFGVTTSTATLSLTGYRLYDSASSGSGYSLVGDTDDCDATVPTDAQHLVECFFDDDANADSGTAAGFGEPYSITAGTTRYFKLSGTFSAVGANDTASVSTVLAGDAAFGWSAASNLATIDGLDQDDFIWSDFNFSQYSTATATTTVGWFNGFRVPGMENTSSTAQVVEN